MPFPESPLSPFTAHSVGTLLIYNNCSYILTAVGRFSCWPEVFPISDITAAMVLSLLVGFHAPLQSSQQIGDGSSNLRCGLLCASPGSSLYQIHLEGRPTSLLICVSRNPRSNSKTRLQHKIFFYLPIGRTGLKYKSVL